MIGVSLVPGGAAPLLPQGPQPIADPQGPVQEPLTGREATRRRFEAEDRASEQMLQASFELAAKSDQALARKAGQVASEIGIDPLVAERSPDVAREIQRRQQLLDRMSSSVDPILHRQLQDPVFARKAFDDYDNLSLYTRAAYGWESGRLMVEKGKIGTRLMLQAFGGSPFDQNDLKSAAEISARLRKIPPSEGVVANTAEAMAQMRDPLLAGTAAAGVAAVAGNAGPQALIPEEIVTVPAAFAAGLISYGVPQAFMVEGGNQFLDLLDKRVPASDAAGMAFGVGTVNAALEFLGGRFLSEPIRQTIGRRISAGLLSEVMTPTMGKAAAATVVGYAKGVAGEVGTEMLQEVSSILAEGSLTGDWEGVGDRLAQIAVKTFQGNVLLGIPGAAMQANYEMDRVHWARKAAQFAQRKAQAVALSKLGAENPDALEQFVNDADAATGLVNVYFDAVALEQMLRQGGKPKEGGGEGSGEDAVPLFDALDKVVPGLSEQVRREAERGGDIVMPSGTFQVKLSGFAGGAMMEHARWGDVDALSSADADRVEELLKEHEGDVEVQAEELKVNRRQLKAIEDSIAAQLQATQLTPYRSASDARAQAKLWPAFIEANRTRLGMTPEQFQTAFPLTAQRGEVPADGVRQEGDDEVVRGAFDPATMRVILTDGANFSTFGHELGHAFMSIYDRLWQQKAHPVFVDDFNAFLKWAGEDAASWSTKTIEQKRAAHEKFAESFEVYLFEGKAPAPELRTLFARFMDFMKRTYASLLGSSAAASRLTPQIRAVMDRMLASEEAVRTTQAIQGAVPAFLTQEESGMDNEQWAQHQQLQQEADDAIVSQVTGESLRVMRWLGRELGKADAVGRKEAKAERAALRPEVEQEVLAQQVYRAQHWLRKGEWVNEDGTTEKEDSGAVHKLNRDEVKRMLGLKALDESDDGKEPAAEIADLLNKLAERKRAQPKQRGKSMVTRMRELGGISWASWNESFPGHTRGEFKLKGVVRGKARDKGGRAPAGMRWEDMAQALREEGYAPQGENAAAATDNSWFVDAMQDAAQGGVRYSTKEEAAQAHAGEDPRQFDPADKQAATEAARLDDEEMAAIRTVIQTRHPQRQLRKLRGMLSDDGPRADDIGAIFGYGSGEQLVRDVLDSPTFDEAVELALDHRMAAEHPELVDPRLRRDAIAYALHHEARQRFVVVELRALDHSLEPVRVTLAAAKEAARQALEQQKVGQLSARTFSARAKRASVEAQTAVTEGDMIAAIRWKRRQLMQEQMAVQAEKQRGEIGKALRLFRSFAKTDEVISKRRDIDMAYAAQALAAAYRLGPEIEGSQRIALVNRGLERLQSDHPTEWERVRPLLDRVKPAHLAGTPTIAQPIASSSVLKGAGVAGGQPMDWRQLTVAEFRELTQAADQVWDAAADWNELSAEGRRVKTQQALGEMAAQLLEAPARPAAATPADDRSPGLVKSAVLEGFSIFASLKIWEHVARRIDGGKDGPFQRYLVLPLMRKVTAYRTAKQSLVQRLAKSIRDAMERHGAAWHSQIVVPGLRSDGTAFHFSGVREILGAMLHAGSHSNLEANLIGRGWGEMVPAKDGSQVLNTHRWDEAVRWFYNEGKLTAADNELLTTWWDTFAELLPQAQETHKKRFGYEFKTIELREVHTLLGTLKGGYVPKRTDRKVAPRKFLARYGSADAEWTAASDDFQYSVGTKKGFTLGRADNYRPPLNLDVGSMVSNVDEELRFIHLEPVINDMQKLLRGRLQSAGGGSVRFEDLLNAYDREMLTRLIVPTMQNAAIQRTSMPSQWPALDRTVRTLKSAASLAFLGLNLANALLQAGGVSNARLHVQGKFLRSASRLVLFSPLASRDFAFARSEMMRQRSDQTIVALEQEIANASRTPLGAKIAVSRQFMARWAFMPQRFFQAFADRVTWHGMYQQAVTEGAAEDVAAERADQAVRLAQGGGTAENLAPFSITHPFMALWTQFGNYSSLVLNQIIGSQSRASAFAWAVFLPAVIETAVRTLFQGGPDDDDGDDSVVDDLAWSGAKSLMRNTVSLIPMVGPLAISMARSDGTRVLEAPGGAMLRELYRGFFEAGEAAFGAGATTPAEWRSIATWLTMLTGIPMAAPVRQIQEALK